MLTRRERPKKKRGETPEDLDLPVAVREQFHVYRLGRKEDHLFLLDTITPITVEGVSAVTRYWLPFSYRLNKVEMYHRNAVGDESDAVLNIRIECLHPNNIPSVIYNKYGVSWPAGQTTLTGKRYMPAGEIDFWCDDNAAELAPLLYVSLEVNVFNVA